MRQLGVFVIFGMVSCVVAAPSNSLPSALVREEVSWAKNHPKIIFTSEGKARVLSRIKNNPEVAELWNSIKGDCDAYVNAKDSRYVDDTKAFDDYLAQEGGTHKKRGLLEGTVRRWLIPMDLLSFGYAVTGDERYGRKSAALAVAAARKLSPDVMKAGFFYTCTFPTRSMALSLDWCYPLFTSEERQAVRQSLANFCNDLYFQSMNGVWGQTTLGRIWNWNAGIASAWGLGSLVIDGETNYPTRQWLFQATRNVEDFLRYAIDTEGGAVEGPSYFGYGSGFLPYFLEGLRVFTGEDLYLATNYRRFASWMPLEILPGGRRINNIMDSGHNIGVSDALLYALYRESDRPLARYLWEQLFLNDGNSASFPSAVLWAPDVVAKGDVSARAAKFPEYGWASGRSVVISRSGYGALDVYFTIHAQHFSLVKHDHADKGQFTLYGYGDDLVIDSGYGNDNNKEKGISGYAHNQILVDGVPQIMGADQSRTDGWILNSFHTPLVDLSEVDIADAYRFYYKNNYQKEFLQEFERAGRSAIFVRGSLPYAIIWDNMKKDDAAHDYSWMLHVQGSKRFEKTDGGINIVPTNTEAITVVTHPVASKDSGPLEAKASLGAGAWKMTANIPKAGKYTVWGLTGTGNLNGAKSDSFFLSINNGKMGFSKGGSKDSFAWATHRVLPLCWVPLNDDNGSLEVPAFQFEEGPVAVKLITRELGACCAAIALVPENSKIVNDLLPEGSVLMKASDGQISGGMVRQKIEQAERVGWLQVRFISPVKWEDKVDSFETTTEGSHPRLSVNIRAEQAQFLTFLIPHPVSNGKLAPASKVERLTAERGNVGRLVISEGVEDVVASSEGRGIKYGNVESDADFLWMRRDGSGKVLAAAGSNASFVVVGGQKIFASSSGRTSFAVSGDRASIPENNKVKFEMGNVNVVPVKKSPYWISRRVTLPPGE